MSHQHSHEGHSHHHPVAVNPNGAYIVGILLNFVYATIQIAMGYLNHSVALLTDAFHNMSDVAGLVLSFMAFRLAKRKPGGSFTYGYKKTTILAALGNAMILMVTVGYLATETVHRLAHPAPVSGGTIASVSGIGIVVNAVSALLFLRDKEQDLNTKSAYLHLMYDALVSMGVVVSGIVIMYTGWYWLDAGISAVILAAILYGTWKLLISSLKLAMDAVPEGVNKTAIERYMEEVDGVTAVRHTHIWAMSTTENALTTHLTLSDSLSYTQKLQLVQHIRHGLLHLNIQHATIELEAPGTVATTDEE